MAKTRFVSGSKARFLTARAAWLDIAKRTGVEPTTHRLRRADTPDMFRWEVLGRKKRGIRTGVPLGRRRRALS